MSEAKTNEQIEAEINRRGLNAPRVTPQSVEDLVIDAQYHVFNGTCLTVCALTLANGFNVVGEAACAHPDNFDPEIGREIARNHALAQVGKLEGYLIKQRIHDGQLTQQA